MCATFQTASANFSYADFGDSFARQNKFTLLRESETELFQTDIAALNSGKRAAMPWGRGRICFHCYWVQCVCVWKGGLTMGRRKWPSCQKLTRTTQETCMILFKIDIDLLHFTCWNAAGCRLPVSSRPSLVPGSELRPATRASLSLVPFLSGPASPVWNTSLALASSASERIANHKRKHKIEKGDGGLQLSG